MSNPNDRQVGGDHYRTTGLQHWDLMHPAYLLGCASKYVSRHKKKNGRQDLEKAIHYCEKYMEYNATDEWAVDNLLLLNWAAEAHMDVADLLILHYILVVPTMQIAIQLIRIRMDACYPVLQNPKPVPLTEENHYSEREDKQLGGFRATEWRP